MYRYFISKYKKLKWRLGDLHQKYAVFAMMHATQKPKKKKKIEVSKTEKLR